MRRSFRISLLAFIALAASAATKPWTAQRANAWYARQPWLVGANYIPANSINELEMWQAESFDPKRIDLELSWAQGLGMNTMRVFLHDLPWQQDAVGYRKRIGTFLTLAAKHRIRPMFVFFDSCWDPAPRLGKQRAPKPGVHNSGWVQAPGLAALADPAQQPRLEAYVKGVTRAFANDRRILGWDVWNEPDNLNDSSYADPKSKLDNVQRLLPLVFDWARSVRPIQPLTSGVWKGDWSSTEKLTPIEKIQLEQSDVLSFHSYDKPGEFEQRILSLKRYGRPMLCTEYMARPRGNTFQNILPLAKEYRVAAYNWGFVQGKTQTYLPWDSWQQPYVNRQPQFWFHDIFLENGEPYRKEEVEFIQRITAPAALRKKAA